jgi:hypothetical protein
MSAPEKKRDAPFWTAIALGWFIWIGSYLAWVVWRADAPVEKDAYFIYLVTPFWVVSAVLIAISEYRVSKSVAWAIASMTLHAIAMLILATFLGIYVHFAAGGTS